MYTLWIFSAWVSPSQISGLTLEQALELRDEYRNQQYLVSIVAE